MTSWQQWSGLIQPQDKSLFGKWGCWLLHFNSQNSTPAQSRACNFALPGKRPNFTSFGCWSSSGHFLVVTNQYLSVFFRGIKGRFRESWTAVKLQSPGLCSSHSLSKIKADDKQADVKMDLTPNVCDNHADSKRISRLGLCRCASGPLYTLSSSHITVTYLWGSVLVFYRHHKVSSAEPK